MSAAIGAPITSRGLVLRALQATECHNLGAHVGETEVVLHGRVKSHDQLGRAMVAVCKVTGLHPSCVTGKGITIDR